MPIPPEIRKQFYSARSGWPQKRAKILKRAGGSFGAAGKYLGGAKCENCGKPDRKRVWVVNIQFVGEDKALQGQAWTERRFSRFWHYCPKAGALFTIALRWTGRYRPRRIKVILTVAHLNHTAGDDRDDNLAAWCQWCHNNHDARMRARHARETRRRRKDCVRPLLGMAS